MTRLLLALLLLAAPALADETPYVTAKQVDLLRLLPPPPVKDGPVDRAEMAEVLALQASRTPERTKQAQADVEESVYAMFTPVLGADFTAARTPLLARMFARLAETEEVVTKPAKDGFARPRPFQANPEVKPGIKLSNSGSWPSGHATLSRMTGTVVAAMVPEQRAAIFERVRDYAESRLIGGVHYRSDLVVGAEGGTALASALFNDAAFMAEFAPARAEVRAALGLAP